jgi:hypothetical protein
MVMAAVLPGPRNMASTVTVLRAALRGAAADRIGRPAGAEDHPVHLVRAAVPQPQPPGSDGEGPGAAGAGQPMSGVKQAVADMAKMHRLCQ